MVGSINLIPQEERVQQTKTKVVKFSTVLAIIILVITLGIGGFFFYQKTKLEKDVVMLDSSITSIRTQINALADIEINARNLYKKTQVLEKIFLTRLYYSTLITEVDGSVPEGVFIESFSLGQNATLNISGIANRYDLIQDLSTNLLDNEAFLDVALNSVSLDNSTNTADFFIVVSYEEGKLHE